MVCKLLGRLIFMDGVEHAQRADHRLYARQPHRDARVHFLTGLLNLVLRRLLARAEDERAPRVGMSHRAIGLHPALAAAVAELVGHLRHVLRRRLTHLIEWQHAVVMGGGHRLHRIVGAAP